MLIQRTTWFSERWKDVKTITAFKSRFMNVDLLSSHFVIIAVCGCKFETLIVNHILTFLVQHVASSFWIVNFRLICINLRFVSRFTWVHFRKYYRQVGEHCSMQDVHVFLPYWTHWSNKSQVYYFLYTCFIFYM